MQTFVLLSICSAFLLHECPLKTFGYHKYNKNIHHNPRPLKCLNWGSKQRLVEIGTIIHLLANSMEQGP